MPPDIISNKNESNIENIQDFDRRAEKIYFESSPTMTDMQHSVYLKKKELTSADIPSLRFGNYYDTPALIIPIKDIEGEIKSIQYIFQDSDGKTQKRFLKDADKKDCFLALDDPKETDQIFITEGIATAGSLRKILANREQQQKTSVVCAFNAEGITKVSKVLKVKFPNSEIIPAPDYDTAGGKTSKNCKDSLGFEPVFPPNKGEDWNDVAVKNNESESAKLLEEALEIRKQAQKLEDSYDHAETARQHVAEKEKQRIPQIEQILEKIDEDPCKDFSMEHFPPILKTYIESLCETTEAHPIMIIMSVICSISAMVGKKVYMKEGEGKAFQDLYPNIWSLCITKSGGFKTTAINKGSEIALEEDRKILQMMKDIEDRDTEYNPLDDKSKLDAKLQAEVLKESLKRPILPTRVTSEFLIKYLAQGHKGMILSSEMGEWLKNLKKTHNGDLKELFTYFYDVDIAPYEQRTKHCGGGIVETPFITINSVSTIDWIQKEVKEEDIFSGFFARILLFAPPANDNIPPARPKKRKKSPEEEKKAKKKIADTLENLGELTFSFSEESGIYFDLIHSSLYQMVQCSKYDDRCQKFLEPYLKRWSPYVIKLAMIFRILEDPLSEELSVSSIKSATEIIKVAIKSTAKLFEKELGESEDQRKQRLVFDWIRKRTTLKTTTKLKHILKSRQLEGGSKEYEEVLETLENAGKVECSNPKTENKKDREYVTIR